MGFKSNQPMTMEKVPFLLLLAETKNDSFLIFKHLLKPSRKNVD